MAERILCVDDEPNVLAGYQRQLRRRVDIDVAEGPEQGLAAVKGRGPYAVVVSDMRMPGLTGAQFLARVKELAPDTVRMLLTGFAEMEAAIAAVNEGNIFRFLTKPCPTDSFMRALEAGLEQHRLITAEKELLEKTLRGCVQVLTEVLSLANPAAFTRTSRVCRLVQQLAAALHVENPWIHEVAALLSQIGCVAVPDDVLAGVYAEKILSDEQWALYESHPRIGRDLIGKIPRLEKVAEIIAFQEKRYNGHGPPEGGISGLDIPLGARILKVAQDCISLETRGHTRIQALECLNERHGWYDPDVIHALARVAPDGVENGIQAVMANDLRCGMVLARDVVSSAGRMMIARGKEISEIVLHRLQSMCATGEIPQPLMVVVSNNSAEPR